MEGLTRQGTPEHGHPALVAGCRDCNSAEAIAARRLYRLLENARKQGDRATYLIVKGRIEALTGVR